MEDKVSVVILNWNAKKITGDCIQSVLEQSHKSYEIILVDNASSDGSTKELKKRFKKIKVVENKKNLGYAGGNNSGLKACTGDYILILNNDTVLDKDFLRALIKNKEKGDILGVKNYYFDKKNILWAVGSELNRFTARASLVGNKEIDHGQYDQTSPPYIVGSSMFIKKEVFKRIGYFDESYFCYFEETEWQTRAINAGYKIGFVPQAKLWHRVAYSSGGSTSPLSAYYLVRNRAHYIRKWSKHKIIAYSVLLAEVLARIAKGIISGNTKYSLASFRGLKDFILKKKGATFSNS